MFNPSLSDEHKALRELARRFARNEIAPVAAEADAGLDYVLMVCAWEDPSCAAEHCLPIASKNEEETIAGQERTIVINVPNHQGPCPPEALGIPPVPQDLYDQILDLWPEYGFKPYAERTENPQCL